MILLLFKLFIFRIVWILNFTAQFAIQVSYYEKSRGRWVFCEDNSKDILQSILRRRTTDSAKEKISLAASWKAQFYLLTVLHTRLREKKIREIRATLK